MSVVGTILYCWYSTEIFYLQFSDTSCDQVKFEVNNIFSVVLCVLVQRSWKTSRTVRKQMFGPRAASSIRRSPSRLRSTAQTCSPSLPRCQFYHIVKEIHPKMHCKRILKELSDDFVCSVILFFPILIICQVVLNWYSSIFFMCLDCGSGLWSSGRQNLLWESDWHD